MLLLLMVFIYPFSTQGQLGVASQPGGSFWIEIVSHRASLAIYVAAYVSPGARRCGESQPRGPREQYNIFDSL